MLGDKVSRPVVKLRAVPQPGMSPAPAAIITAAGGALIAPPPPKPAAPPVGYGGMVPVASGPAMTPGGVFLPKPWAARPPGAVPVASGPAMSPGSVFTPKPVAPMVAPVAATTGPSGIATVAPRVIQSALPKPWLSPSPAPVATPPIWAGPEISPPVGVGPELAPPVLLPVSTRPLNRAVPPFLQRQQARLRSRLDLDTDDAGNVIAFRPMRARGPLPAPVIPPAGGAAPAPAPAAGGANLPSPPPVSVEPENPGEYVETEPTPDEAITYDFPEGDVPVGQDENNAIDPGSMPADAEGMSGVWSVLVGGPQSLIWDTAVNYYQGNKAPVGKTLSDLKADMLKQLDALTKKIGDLNGAVRDYERRRRNAQLDLVRVQSVQMQLTFRHDAAGAAEAANAASILKAALDGHPTVRAALTKVADAVTSFNNKFRQFVKLPPVEGNMGEPITVSTIILILAALAIVAGAVVLAISAVQRQTRLLEEARIRAQLLRDGKITPQEWANADKAAQDADAKSDPASSFFKGAGGVMGLAVVGLLVYFFMKAKGARK